MVTSLFNYVAALFLVPIIKAYILTVKKAFFEHISKLPPIVLT